MIETHGLSTTSAHYARMGRQECEKIHRASLEILERVGVDVHDEKARDLLLKGEPEWMVSVSASLNTWWQRL